MGKRTYEVSLTAKRRICAVLKTLMAQKPLNRISVAEVMAACGMSRQHFYYHFDDFCGAVRWMLDEEAMALLRAHEGALLWQDGLLRLFQYLQREREVCLCALNSLGRDSLRQLFRQDIQAIIQGAVRSIVGELDARTEDRDVDLLTQFYVGALTGLMENWLVGTARATPEEMIALVDRVLRDHVAGAALRLGCQPPWPVEPALEN